ncbi:MAG: LysR family transcriptional regulator [Lysobacter sp.]|nr:LysR family transcriptional regulator [Lysobacter sp.]
MQALDNLDELKTFALVVETGSLSSAARLMQLTTNAVSRRMIRLEQNLGIKVLRRSTRAVSVTAEGRVLYAHARRALEELKAAEDTIRSGLNGVQGTLRVAMPGGACSPGILGGIATFLEANPELRLEMLVVNTPVDPIGGGFDVVVHVGPPRDSRLNARRLHSVSWALAAAPYYFVSRRKPKTPSDLSEHVCLRITSNPPQNEWRLIDKHGNVESVHVTGNFEADDSRVLADAMYAGLGIGLRPEKELIAAVEAGTLVRVLPQHRFASMDVYALMPKGTSRLARVSKFLDFFADLLRKEA